MNKTSLLYWIIALLLILNLSTIGGLIYHHYDQLAEEQPALILDVQNDSRLTGRYFRQVIGFDDEQMEAFRKANRKFQPAANQIIFTIDSLKQEQFNELKKKKSDTVRLFEIAEKIGTQHKELKNITNRFYLEIKKACDEEQCNKLEEVFHPLFKNTIQGGRHRNKDIN
jgi:hypothetical protein